MNEIVAYTAPAGVSLVDIRMNSTAYPRIKTLNRQSAVARLQQVVAMAYVYTGRSADESKIEMVATALYSELMEDKRHLGIGNITIEEIAHAVKDAILQANREDVYINIAFLYKAVCAYAEGEGHDAQEEAYRRIRAQRQKAIAATPVGTMLATYESRILNSSKK